MDLYADALSQNKHVDKYIQANYGPIPRLRGVRFMRYEVPETCDGNGPQAYMWESYCGKDVIYIHTRCGGNNYESCGGKDWEEAHKDSFLDSVDDEFDSTYRDHYFTAIIDDDYNKICELIEQDVVI